jgi:uncharacterized protein
MKRTKQTIFIILGSLMLVIGVIGIVLPVIPTTPFLILTMILYAKGSDRVRTWFMGTRIYQKHLLAYAKTRKMSSRTKRDALILVTILIGALIVLVEILVMRIILGIVLMGHYVVLLFHIKTLTKADIDRIGVDKDHLSVKGESHD